MTVSSPVVRMGAESAGGFYFDSSRLMSAWFDQQALPLAFTAYDVGFESASSQAFIVAAGPSVDGYIATLADGTFVVVDNQNLDFIDAEDGTADGLVNVDALVDGDSNDDIVSWTATLFSEAVDPSFVPTPARSIPEKGELMKTLAQRLAKDNKSAQESHNSQA